MPADHSAVDSTLGYAFQTLHALVILLRAADNESVSIELTDDVTLHHSRSTLNSPEETRLQLAHSIRARMPELGLSSAKLWKTIRIWASEYNPNERYFLITCAPICSELECLAGDADRAGLQRLLEDEANRVVDERDRRVHAHDERISGCRAFLGLSPALRFELLKRTTGLNPRIETFAIGTLSRERTASGEANDWAVSQSIPKDGGRAAKRLRQHRRALG
ncbi:MAG: hypothetical protein JWN34_5534 [Bryobacterales bacterium]|nr:hypothetical protein [Bryobacterales bacterium]